MPSVIIIAGPNGAGKTTFANEYLSAEERRFEFVNADEIARGLDVPVRTDMLAGRMMLERIDELVAANSDFVIETTLASLTYARKIPDWRKLGYQVTLIYLRLPSVSASLARVRKRVAAGGHNIPEETVRRRFERSRAEPCLSRYYLQTDRRRVVSLRESRRRFRPSGFMETIMSEKPDATKIEAALKRAAYKALHGTREERSGRFLLKQETSSASGHRDATKGANLTKRKA